MDRGRTIVAWVLGGLLLAAAVPAATADGGGGESEEEEEEETAAKAPPSPPKIPLGKRVANGVRHVKDDAVYLLTFPSRPTRKGVVTASSLLGGIVVLSLLDDEIRERAQEERNPTLDDWEGRIEPLGDARVTSTAALLVYATGALSGKDEVTETGRALVEALAFASVFQAAGKGLLGRCSPGDEARASEWFDCYPHGIFPSGHSAHAFAFATVLAERYGRVAAWIGYPLAVLVGLSRIESDAHWASDVLAGAALGWGVGRAIVRRRAGRARRRAPVTPFLQPAARGVGVTVALRF